MDITRYIFQSPFSSQVQIGKLDESVKSRDNPQKESDKGSADFAEISPSKSVNIEATVEKKVQSTSNSQSKIDMYV
jgi:hypothetical protein